MVFTSIKTGRNMDDRHGHVKVESVLRLRPLLKKEREENVVLEQQKNVSRNSPATVILHPPRVSISSPDPSSGKMRSRAESDATMYNTPSEYHFNQVLPETTSQDKIYYSIGLPIATEAMTSLTKAQSKKSTKSHLMICMGVCNSGKTYTCFGGSTIPKRRAAQDGIVPRLVDSLFSQSKHHANGDSRGFAVKISMVQVDHCKGNDPEAYKIHDLLGSSGKKKQSMKTASPNPKIRSVRSMAAKFEKALPAVASPIRSPLIKSQEYPEVDSEDPNPTVETCRDVTEAREILQNGLDASRKSGRGNQSSHLLVTLQPTVNDNQYGDKISILDMAGLEKCKRTHNRVKDSVVSMNQAACGAVLHCLRAMIYNTDIQMGKVVPLDIADDLASEISCVSQEKDQARQSLKTVPFRPNKVTMLLRPLFSNTQSTNVTLLMNAYPGHADYAEKKSLLQDMELLCGSALLSANARVSTGFEQHSDPSVLSSVLSEVEADYGYENSSSVHSRRSFSSNQFALPRDNPVKKAARKSEDMVMSARPPAYAPSFVKDTATPYRTSQTQALAEAFSPSRGDKNPGYVSDFPGVNIPSSPLVTPNVASGQKPPSSPFYEADKKEQTLHSSRGEKHMGTNERRIQNTDNGNKDPRVPLGRSSLENSESIKRRQSSSYGKKISLQGQLATKTKLEAPESHERVIIHQERLREKERLHTPFTKKQIDVSGTLKSRIQELEAEVKALHSQKSKTEQRCNELKFENQNLKSLLDKQDWAKKEEEEFLHNRKLRLEDQTLLKAPLCAHLKQVDYIYDIKNQWCMTDKPHFSLQFPRHFQRAPDLDIRDRINEELEAAMEGSDI